MKKHGVQPTWVCLAGYSCNYVKGEHTLTPCPFQNLIALHCRQGGKAAGVGSVVTPHQAQLGSGIIGLTVQSSQHVAHMGSHCLQTVGSFLSNRSVANTA